jgi:hypothetical protein
MPPGKTLDRESSDFRSNCGFEACDCIIQIRQFVGLSDIAYTRLEPLNHRVGEQIDRDQTSGRR